MTSVLAQTPKLRDLDMNQVFRYMGMRPEAADDALRALARDCLPGFLEAAKPRACCLMVPVKVQGNTVNVGVCRVESADLARNLTSCGEAILFAATLGPEVDRQRRTAAVTSPTKALILDAMGTAGIEAVCDDLCRRFAAEHPGRKLRPRFSPGYGDLPLDFQRTLLGVLDSQRKAGISLSESLLMVPQKSVSAIVGLGESGCTAPDSGCDICEKKDCEFRL